MTELNGESQLLAHFSTKRLHARQGNLLFWGTLSTCPSGTLPYGCLYPRGRIIRLDELGQTFVIRLVIRL